MEIKSEQMKEMTPEMFAKLQRELEEASPEDMRAFIDSLDPDKMGFDGEEGV